MITDLLPKIMVNLTMLILLGLIYYAIRKRMLYLFTSILIGLTTFSLVYVLGKNEFGIATGIGLFAIFGIIRYRTEQVPIVEMTYIFVCITISLINALVDDLTITTFTAITINLSLIIVTGILLFINNKTEYSKLDLIIDTIDWISMEESEIIKFLNSKSFKKIQSYNIIHIDHLKETCSVSVYYK